MKQVSIWKCAAISIVAAAVMTFIIGLLWFGWGYVADNKQLLNSLSVPPGAQRVSVSSSAYSPDDSVLTPPDGWVTLATYEDSAEASKEEILSFYLSKFSPAWASCVHFYDTGLLYIGEAHVVVTGASFTKGQALVHINIDNMRMKNNNTFIVSVDHKNSSNPCN